MTPREQLAEWVQEKHQDQLIKKTSEPYFTHLVAVAEMAGPYTALGYEIGICHDIFEDTLTTKEEFYRTLISLYREKEAAYVTACVTELTDVFTAESYPLLPKKQRKQKEAARLCGISPAAQTVKYADLIYNINWVMEFDLKHAEKYLNRKRELLSCMTDGNPELHQKAMATVCASLIRLKEE